MEKIDLAKYEPLFKAHMKGICDEAGDVSHDLLHVLRVVKVAKKLCRLEGANPLVVVPAAYLHDSLYISKKDPRRSKASTLSADYALTLLIGWGYPEQFFDEIHHAIRAHSFSARVEAETLEAKIVQDADRIDGLGAIGVCRSMAFTGFVNRPIYNVADPFCKEGRLLDDSTNTLDHYFVKLMKVADMACTPSGKKECIRRTKFMDSFLKELEFEIT